MSGLDVADLGILVAAVRRNVVGPQRLYLVNATTHVAMGWRQTVPRFELAGDAVLDTIVRDAAESMGIEIKWEAPADIVPAPAGWEERSRPVAADVAGTGSSLDVRHCDPYLVVLRLIARGDEPDYVDALQFIRRGWVEMPRLEGVIQEMLPRMTMATIAQDPAEFRRKYKGLRQLVSSEENRSDAIGFTAATWV